MLALIISTFFSLIAHAQELKLVEDKFILSSPNCSILQNQIEALQKWKNQREGLSQICGAMIEARADVCSSDVSSCIPDIVKELHETTNRWDGPNCFNLAMVTSGFMKHKIYEDGDTFKFYVQSPLCKRLNDGESPGPGDIGIIVDKEDRVNLDFIHGFTWISPQMVFSKNGLATKHPYLVQPFEEMYQKESVTWECQDSPKLLLSSDVCKRKVISFRCKSFEDYLANSPTLSEEIQSNISQLEKVESCFEQAYFFGKNGPTERFATSITNYLEPLRFYLNQQNPTTPEEIFVLGMLKLRLKALESQETSDYLL